MPIKVTNQNNEETNNNDNADSLYQSNMQMYNAYRNGDLFDYDDTPQQVSSDSEWADFGNSMFDNSMVMNVSEGDLNEMRANNQGWLSKTGSALGNATVTAATTFLDNTVGFLWGIGSAAVNGDLSKLWDNDFSNAMADINDWANENMSYYTTKYDQDLLPFVGDFILNDLVRNSGFQIGTGLSMIVPGAILKVPGSALKLTKMASNFMKSGRAIRTGSAMKDLALSTWMSFGEASIEALNNKRDFVKYQTQLMNDEFAQKTAALDEQWKQLVIQKYGGNEEAARASMDFNEYYNQKQELASQKAQKAKFIEHEATKVGDITALANMAVLTPTNFMTFGKAFTGYNLNKRFGQIATDIVDAKGNVLKKNVLERTAKDVARTGKIQVKNPNYGKWGYNKEGKWVKDTEKYIEKEAKVQMRGKEKSALWEVGKNMLDEGNEEMMQEVGAQYSTALAETDMLNYEALAESGMAYDDILKQINSSWINFGEMANAFGKVYTDPAQYRQFFGGAFGMLISPHFTRKPGGGVQFHLNNIGGEMAAVREQNSTNALIAEDINKMLNSDESKNYLKGMLRHAALEHVKQDAVTADSKIDYEDADFAQFVSDITTMSNAGKLPLLQAHLDGLRNMSDEELEETCMNMCTDKKVTYTDENGKKKTKTIKVGDFVDSNGNFIGNTPEGKQKVREKLNKRIDRLQKDIDLYQSTMNDIDGATGGALDHETLAAFTWEKAQVMNKYSRAKEIIGSKDSISNIGVYQKYISDSALRLTNEKTSAEQELKQEKDRLSHLPKIDGKPVEASVQQKNLEAKIKDLTTQINRTTEISELLRKMSAFEVRNGNYEDDKKAIIELFDEYRDIAKVMPEIAKLVGVTDENGKKLKTKNGKDREFPLEYILYTNQFDAFMQKIAGAKVDGIKDVSKDYEDAARLYARARQTEASIDNLIDDPTQYTAHRAELQQRILEHENKKTISKIQKEIEKGLDEGRITLDNLEEESKKITDSINSINSERGAARQLFDRAVAALSNTPYDELRQIAIRNIMQSKKYKNLGDMRDLINYVYMNIAANPKLSDAEKQVAMESFNKFIKGKKSIDEVHKSKVTPDNVNVESLYVLDTPENQEAKRALIGKDPKISLDNYRYTEQSYNAAQIAKNEIPQIINDAVEKIYKAKNQPELADQLTTLGIDENKVAAGTESAKTRAEIDNKAKSIEQGINKLLETFKGGEILNNEEKNELFNKVQDLIDKTFNSDDYADDYKAEIDNLNLRWKAQSLDMIQNNLEQRVSSKYNDTDIEGRIEVEKAFDEINKEVSKIQRSLEQSKGGAAFNDIFDRISKEDYSVEPKNSFDIYYNSNGTIYRGHAVPCESLLNGRKCYAVAQQLDVDSFQYDIIDENGAIIGRLFSNELVEPSKRGESIKLDFTKLTSYDVNTPNLQVFREITTLKVPNITSEKIKRDVTERCKACRESFQEDGILDENGETKLQSNILSTIAKANMIMNAELTESKAEIEDVVETPTEVKKEHTGIKYFLLQDENGDMVRVMFQSNGNRVTFKDENGKTTTKKYSKALFKKEGYDGVIRETYGNEVEIVESSQEEWNPKAKAETKQKPLFDLDNVDTRKVDVEIVDKPWKSDSTKSNKTLRIYIKNQHQKGYFELVKDQEDGYYSVHFKTATDNKNNDKYNNENAEVSTKYDRSILFDQLLNAIPDGSFFSTWGSLSPAGVKAVEKLGKMAGNNIVGYREVESKEDGSKIQLPIYVKGKQSEQTEQQSTTESKPTTETPTQPTVVEQKKQQRKKTEAKRKRAISQLDEQIAELDNMLARLQEAAKQNPQYHDTVRTVTTFKQYVEFVRNNYKALGEPKNVVLDENQVFSMMDSFRQQLGKIFDNDVQFLSNEEIEQAAKDANNDSQFQTIDTENTELDSIKEQAIADGTFMKAPNGKPTNLNERQWLQVRTKAFKEWFGDWERLYLYNQYENGLNNGDYLYIPKDNNLYRKITSNEQQNNVTKYFKNSLFRGVRSNYTIDDDGNLHIIPSYDNLFKNIGLSLSRDLDSAISYGYRYSEQPVIYEIDADYLDKKYPYKKDAKTNDKNVRGSGDLNEERIFTDEEIIIPNGKFVETRLNKTLNFDGLNLKELYSLIDYVNYETELVENSIGEGSDYSTKFTKEQISELYKKKDELLNKFKDSVSKVVDENGEPKIVYHYSYNENLNEFSTDFDNYFSLTGGTKKAIFFTEDNPTESDRGNNFITKRGKKIEAFLNIKDLTTYEGTKEDLHKKGTSYREVVNKSAEKNDIDGGLHMTKFDDNKKLNQDIWIIHNANQVKSATDNVGTFSRENDDIRFSKSNGEIYGFANEGKVVLNKDKFRPDAPVHEYTHLWDKACMEHSPELWKRGVELMKQTDEWQRVIEDDNYANIKDNEDLVASEVHSRLSGMLAAGKAIEFAGNKRIKKGFWAKLIEWFIQFKDFTLHHVFGMSKEDAQKVTLEQFLSAPVADFMLGTDPRDVNNTNYTIASKPKKQAKPVDTSLKVGDTVQYSGVAKKAVVRSITSKGITIETEDGRQYKNVAQKHLQYLYGQKPSANAKFEDLDDAVSPEEFIARKLVGVKINDTNKDITNIDKKLASKEGKTIDELVLAIKDEIPFSISDDEIKDNIIDIASGRSINDIKQYAIDSHYAAQDAEYQAQMSAIDNAQTTIQGETETFTPDEFYDDVDFVFGDEARNAIDNQIADEEYERSYQEYLEQRANEENALTDEQWFEVFGEKPQENSENNNVFIITEKGLDKLYDSIFPKPRKTSEFYKSEIETYNENKERIKNGFIRYGKFKVDTKRIKKANGEEWTDEFYLQQIIESKKEIDKQRKRGLEIQKENDGLLGIDEGLRGVGAFIAVEYGKLEKYFAFLYTRLKEIQQQESQLDPVVEQIKTKAEELKDKVENVPPTPFNIINDESGLDTLKNLAKKAKSEETQPLDTFKPAISEWWIDDKSIPAIVGLRKKYPKANFEYIYQLYKSTGAYDYVKEGKLRQNQEVYIGYGQVGKLGNGTPLYNVVFFVKDDKGNYQLIGTLSDTANQDPKTAKELHEQVEKLYNEQDTNGFFTDITITNTKPYVSEESVRGQNVVVASGEKTFHFYILAPNGNPITTTVSKVLNGSLMWSETQHSLKETTLPDSKTIAKAISENENGKHVRIGYFDASTQLHDNMTADEQQIGLLEGFRNVGSKTKGHIVLILNKPDGRYQLVPMHVALFGDLMDNPYNPIVNDVNNILKKAWQIYSDNSMSIDDKDFELTKSGGIIQQLNEKLHFSDGQLHLFFEGKNGGISLSANGKPKVKNADGTLPRPKSEVEFLQLFNYQLADCMININEKNISDPKVLNKLIMSDVFSTNLSGTDFRNAFFTVKPIDAQGKIKEVYRDMPEQYILKSNKLKKIYGDKVTSIGNTDVYLCEDLDGDISLYGVEQGTDEYNSDLLKNITTPSQRARMLAYAKIKAGMNPKGEFERKDIPADYIQEIDGKEYIVHPTIYGDEEYYDTETFVKQNPDAVGEETQEGGQQAANPVTTYKPQEHKPIVNEKLIKDAFTSSKFAKAFIELERLINNPDSKVNLLKSTIDSISKEQLEDYIQGQKQRLSTSTKRTLLSLESRFGIDTLKMFASVKDIYDSNVFSDLYDLLDSVTDADGNIDYSALTQEQIDKVFDRNKIITDDNMFYKNKACEAF